MVLENEKYTAYDGFHGNPVQERTNQKTWIYPKTALPYDVICFIHYAFFNPSVSFMKERLDQDSMGIILLQNFLREFFPGEVWWSIKYADLFCIKGFYYQWS